MHYGVKLLFIKLGPDKFVSTGSVSFLMRFQLFTFFHVFFLWIFTQIVIGNEAIHDYFPYKTHHWNKAVDSNFQISNSVETRRSRSVYLCQLVDKMWKLLILLSSDCVRKTWLLSYIKLPNIAAVQCIKYYIKWLKTSTQIKKKKHGANLNLCCASLLAQLKIEIR